jgi:hypothetical protein
MALVPGNPLENAVYDLRIETTPRAVTAGKPARFRFNVTHPVTRSPVTEFAVVHDRPFHLFVVSQDMRHFFHVHPEQDKDGVFAIDLTLPEPGYYKLYSDFLPLGGGPQVIGRPLVTARYDGDIMSSLAKLKPDYNTPKTVDGMIVGVEIEASELVAGKDFKLKFKLTDQATGEPVKDLEPYLGAWGHALILSGDMVEYIHAHPEELVPEEAERATLRGGPEVTFDGLFPKPGHYRVWAQFFRRGTVTTVPFTFYVARLGETIGRAPKW